MPIAHFLWRCRWMKQKALLSRNHWRRDRPGATPAV
jgi:hypothetical protein